MMISISNENLINMIDLNEKDEISNESDKSSNNEGGEKAGI
jgi:hypothetical protein